MSLLSCLVHAELEIDATPEEVWQVITDLEGYPQWHPVVISTSGDLAVGARQVEVVQTARGRQFTFHPVLTVVAPGRELTRQGRLLAPGVFTNVHSYRMEPIGPNRVRVTQSERFSGLLAPFLRGRLAKETVTQFNEALVGLARRIESHRARPMGRTQHR